MTPRSLTISVTQEKTAEGLRRVLHVTGTLEKERPSFEVYYDLLGVPDAPSPVILDGFVYPVLLYAMKHEQDIHVKGALTKGFYRNNDDFQDAWSVWKPKLYKKIKITCDNVVDPAPRPITRAISTYSGGVDGTLTAARHRPGGWLGVAAYPLDAVMTVHGFDVSLQARKHFDDLVTKTQPFVDAMGLKRFVIRTNSRELVLGNWEDTHALELAACLFQYAHDYPVALVASTDPYDHLIIPYGSNPITDRLMTNGLMEYIHDGCRYSRTERAVAVASIESVRKTLSVCWQGTVPGVNCCVCEKCIRTQMAFMAAGVHDAPCFPKKLVPETIEKMSISNDTLYHKAQQLMDYLDAHQVKGDWVDAFRRRLALYRKPSIVDRILFVLKLKYDMHKRKHQV